MAEPRTVPVELLKVSAKEAGTKPTREEVALEARVRLFVDGSLAALLMSTPVELRELAVGYLYSEGLIDGPSDVEVSIDGLDVHASLRPRRERPLAPVRSDLVVEVGTVLRGMEALEFSSRTYRRTGGTHTAALMSPEGDVVAVAEDVGRHNALDKAVGKALLAGRQLGYCFAVFTGRLSYEVVLKVVRCGIPLISSISAPTSLGIELAEEHRVSLVGFARRGSFNVYTHPWRLGLASPKRHG